MRRAIDHSRLQGRLTGADCYGLGNLANLDHVSRRGATVVGLIPYERGSGGHGRIFAPGNQVEDDAEPPLPQPAKPPGPDC